MKTWIDFTEKQYDRCVCTSYIGGSSWFRSPEYPNNSLVAHGQTPIEIREYFLLNHKGTVRFEVFRPIT